MRCRLDMLAFAHGLTLDENSPVLHQPGTTKSASLEKSMAMHAEAIA